MEFEKIEGSRKGSFIYCANGYIYTKNNEYKGKINLRCRSYKKKVVVAGVYAFELIH